MSFSDEFIKVLDALGSRIGVAIDWTSQNIAPKIMDLSIKVVAYKMVMNWIWIIIGLAILLLIIPLTKNFFQTIYEGIIYLKGCLVFICAVLGLIFVFSHVSSLVACYTFPEKVVVDYVLEVKTTMDRQAEIHQANSR